MKQKRHLDFIITGSFIGTLLIFVFVILILISSVVFYVVDPYNYSFKTNTLLVMKEGSLGNLCPLPIKNRLYTSTKTPVDYQYLESFDTIVFWGHGNSISSCGVLFDYIKDKKLEVYSCNIGNIDKNIKIVKGNRSGFMVNYITLNLLIWDNNQISNYIVYFNIVLTYFTILYVTIVSLFLIKHSTTDKGTITYLIVAVLFATVDLLFYLFGYYLL